MIIKEMKKDIRFLKGHTLQPGWWKIAKVLLLIGVLIAVYFIFNLQKTIIWVSIFVGLSLILHFTYRIKTKTYTRSWMDFKVIEIDGKPSYSRIGIFYYSLVILFFIAATVTVILLP